MWYIYERALSQFQKSVTFEIGYAIACVCFASAAPNRGFRVLFQNFLIFERASYIKASIDNRIKRD